MLIETILVLGGGAVGALATRFMHRRALARQGDMLPIAQDRKSVV